MMLGITYLGEAVKELSLVSMIGQLWALPFLIFLNMANLDELNRWVLYTVITLLLIYPNGTSPPEPAHLPNMPRLTTPPQHIPFKSAGTRATPTPCAHAPCPRPATTCSCREAVSSPRTSTEKVTPPRLSLATW